MKNKNKKAENEERFTLTTDNGDFFSDKKIRRSRRIKNK
jgi:hypothetical protein